jgi:hypothetical protein
MNLLWNVRLLNFASEYVIRKVQENQVGLKLNGTHQLLASADEVNLLEDNIEAVKRNTETFIDASEEVAEGINVEKTKYEEWCLLGCYAVWLL